MLLTEHLTPAEIGALREDAKRLSDVGQKAFAHLRTKQPAK
jgi:hypothetical protein